MPIRTVKCAEHAKLFLEKEDSDSKVTRKYKLPV